MTFIEFGPLTDLEKKDCFFKPYGEKDAYAFEYINSKGKVFSSRPGKAYSLDELAEHLENLKNKIASKKS